MGLKKCTVFNLGSGQTTVSSFASTSGGKLSLSAFYQRTFSCPNDEDEWIDQIADSIKEAIDEHHLKGEVSVILPSSKLLVKTSEFPRWNLKSKTK